MAAASIMATWFAAETLMGASQTAYDYGFQGVIFDPFGASCLFVLIRFILCPPDAPGKISHASWISLNARYNKPMIVLSVIAEMPDLFLMDCSTDRGRWCHCQGIFGVDPTWGMVIIITIVAAYTTMGGMLADTLAGFLPDVPDAGGITLVFICMLNAVGGFPGLFNGAGIHIRFEPFTLLTDHSGEGYLGYTGSNRLDVLACSMDGHRFGYLWPHRT